MGIRSLLVLAFLVLPFWARAAETVRPAGAETLQLTHAYEALFDPTGSLTLGDVLASAEFRPQVGPAPNFGFRPGSAWGRVRIDLTGEPKSQQWRFVMDILFIDHADLYVVDDQGRQLGHFRFGVLVGPPEGDAHYHWADLSRFADQPFTLYLRTDSRYAQRLNSSLKTVSAQMLAQATLVQIHSVLLGAMLISGMIFGLTALVLRSPLHAEGCALALSATWGNLFTTGFNRTLGLSLSPGDDWLACQLVFLPVQVLVPVFVARFSGLDKRHPRLFRRGLGVLLVIIFAEALIDIFLPYSSIAVGTVVLYSTILLSVALAFDPQASRGIRIASLSVSVPYAIALFVFLTSFNFWLPDLLPFRGWVIYLASAAFAFLLVGFLIAVSLQLRNDLERTVALRTRQLSEAKAEADLALAGERQALLRLRSFIDMATHEFKTPLATIDGATQVLELMVEPAPPQVSQRLALIRSSVHRIVDLVDACLNDERRAKLDLMPEAFSPAELVMLSIGRLPPDKSGRVIVQCDSLPELLMADPDLLGIALDALIDNACKYSEGPVEVSARFAQGTLSLSVADRGPGVKAGEEEWVFEKYFRGVGSSAIAGTGVGLHVVRTIAELHGGAVVHQSRPGGGAVFMLSIQAELAIFGRAAQSDARTQTDECSA